MIRDMSPTFVEAPMQRNLFIELVDEDMSEDDEANVMLGYLSQT